ncbi:MAG: twin-arginine translocation signal domain-containing protein, partial [Planctomycetales bacterium]|nr:twin-arginine translocation signal domain-containing protein [Planctomycetales bacterium]
MNINPNRSLPELATRRSFLNATGASIGAMALGGLLQRDAGAESTDSRWPGVIQEPHVPPRAKRVIFLCMA